MIDKASESAGLSTVMVIPYVNSILTANLATTLFLCEEYSVCVWACHVTQYHSNVKNKVVAKLAVRIEFTYGIPLWSWTNFLSRKNLIEPRCRTLGIMTAHLCRYEITLQKVQFEWQNCILNIPISYGLRKSVISDCPNFVIGFSIAYTTCSTFQTFESLNRMSVVKQYYFIINMRYDETHINNTSYRSKAALKCMHTRYSPKK